MFKILTVKYQGVLLFEYNICKAKNLRKYNSSKTPYFRPQHNNLKQYRCILTYQSHYYINITAINLKNKSYFCFFSKHFSIQINYLYSKYYFLNIQASHLFKNSFLCYKMYVINSINLYIEFNIYIKINVNLANINQLLIRLLLSSIPKNLYNLIYCIRLKTNLVTEDNFIFKLNIFYNKYQFVSLFLDAYLESAFVILTSLAQTHFNANYNSIISFEDFC